MIANKGSVESAIEEPACDKSKQEIADEKALINAGYDGHSSGGAWGGVPAVDISESPLSSAAKISNTVTEPTTLSC